MQNFFEGQLVRFNIENLSQVGWKNVEDELKKAIIKNANNLFKIVTYGDNLQYPIKLRCYYKVEDKSLEIIEDTAFSEEEIIPRHK